MTYTYLIYFTVLRIIPFGVLFFNRGSRFDRRCDTMLVLYQTYRYPFVLEHLWRLACLIALNSIIFAWFLEFHIFNIGIFTQYILFGFAFNICPLTLALRHNWETQLRSLYFRFSNGHGYWLVFLVVRARSFVLI